MNDELQMIQLYISISTIQRSPAPVFLGFTVPVCSTQRHDAIPKKLVRFKLKQQLGGWSYSDI